MSLSQDQARKILKLLGDMAFYNDKGYVWARDTAAQIVDKRLHMRKQLDDLIAEIGEPNIGPALLDILRRPEIAEDFSGRYCERVAALIAETDG